MREYRDCSRPRELTGRTVLFLLLGFFAAVAAVNAVLVRAAVSTFGGVEIESAYQAGLAFSREAAAAAAQDARHWQVSAKVVSAGERASSVEVIAANDAGRPLAGLRATAQLVHPADRRADHAVVLAEKTPGTYQGTTEAVIGQWDLVIELARGGTRMFRSRNRITVQ